MQRDRYEAPRRVARQESLRQSPHLADRVEVTMHVLEDGDDLQLHLDRRLQILNLLGKLVADTRRKTPVNIMCIMSTSFFCIFFTKGAFTTSLISADTEKAVEKHVG